MVAGARRGPLYASVKNVRAELMVTSSQGVRVERIVSTKYASVPASVAFVPNDSTTNSTTPSLVPQLCVEQFLRALRLI